MKKFYWGAATSAHQVEGNNHNNWSEWELINAERLARNAQKNPPTGGWPEYILNPSTGGPNPLQEENYISGRSCDHYNRFEEDFDIAKSLGHNAHRFSIEWSRIEPEEGKFDSMEIEHYRKVISELKKRGLEPFVTIWHWTLPQWLSAKGGVQNADFPAFFARYAEKLVLEFKNEVKFWFTINEPEIYCLNSYFRGRWPPEKTGPIHFYSSINNLIKAHKAAYVSIKRIDRDSVVAIVCNLSDFKSSGAFNHFLKIISERYWNHYFLNKVRGSMDAIGLNYYFHNRIRYGFNKNTNEVVSDVGWDLHPEGIESVLLALKKYNKPIYVTESGVADSRDIHREWFISQHVRDIQLY